MRYHWRNEEPFVQTFIHRMNDLTFVISSLVSHWTALKKPFSYLNFYLQCEERLLCDSKKTPSPEMVKNANEFYAFPFSRL